MREVLHQRALPRATRNLEGTTGGLGDRAGILGAQGTAVDHVYSPSAVDRALGLLAARGHPR